MIEALKLLFDNDSEKMSQFFNKWIKQELKENEPLIQHFVVNSILVEKFIKFVFIEENRVKNQQKANENKFRKNEDSSFIVLDKSLKKNPANEKTHGKNANVNFRKQEYENLLNELFDQKDNLLETLTTVTTENQKNISRGSKNLYLSFYFNKSPMLIEKLKNPHSNKFKQSLANFFEYLWEENQKKIMNNIKNNYFENLGSKISMVSMQFSSIRSNRFNSSLPFRMSKVGPILQKDKIKRQKHENSFFVDQFVSENHHLTNTHNQYEKQFNDFLQEEERMVRIREVLSQQHLIFNNPKFHYEKYLSVIKICKFIL
jgi:hypothetical protein